MAGFLADRTGRAWSEQRLSSRERAIVALTTDISRQALGESFSLHIRQALETGANPRVLRDAVRFCAEMSLTKATEALRVLDTMLETERNVTSTQ